MNSSVSLFKISRFAESVETPALASWIEQLMPDVNKRITPDSQRNFPRWLNALGQLPVTEIGAVDLNNDIITTTAKTPPDLTQTNTIQKSLMGLHPWRKGPFNLHGTFIDTEWRCDKKWARLAPHIDLTGRTVLDVGSGNGYYSLRMLGAGAKTVVGLDTSLLYCTQFQAITHFTGNFNACVLPVGVEVLVDHPQRFDTVFSMGVLYHRRRADEHLRLLHSSLADGGELVLETLIIAGDESDELIPDDRYANMRNVWSLPTVSRLQQQLTRAGFTSARCVDVTQTTVQEQRPTEWMTFHSLQHSLDSDNPNLTIEGHPAPIRAIIIASK